MADVFSTSFAAESHTAWAASQYAWDPSQLQALPLAASPASGSTGAASEHLSEGPCSSAGAQRDQSLGPVPVGWQESTRAGAGGGNAGGKELKGAHTRAPKGPLVCQVEGCGHDLSLEKGYYQRYRVCEPHMKLLSLVVNGKACRFCQQCGRFQELTEFDGNKRSCRARLLQHNARRRKRDPLETSRKDVSGSRRSKTHHPWSDSSNDADMGHGSGDLSIGMNDKVMTNYSAESGVDQGIKVRMGAAPVSSGGMTTWNVGINGAVETPAGVNQFQAMLQPPLAVHMHSGAVDADLARCFSGGTDVGDALDEMLDGILNSKTDYLEDPRAALQAPGAVALPILGGAFGAAGSGLASGPVSGGSLMSGPEVKPPQLGMMSLAMNSSPPLNSNNAPGRGFGGHWGTANMGNTVSMPEVMSGSMQLNSSMGHAAVGMNGIASGMSGMASGMATSGPLVAPPANAATPASSSFDLARRLVASGGAAAQYQSEDLLVRVSIKIANCTPDQLPVDLYQRLRNLLNTADASLVQGFLRPGCTHLVLDVQVDRSARGNAGLDGFGDDGTGSVTIPGLAVSAMDVRKVLGPVVSRSALLVQMENEVAMWPAGAPMGAKPHHSACVADLQASGQLPVIQHVSPAAYIDGAGRAALLVFGVGLCTPGVELCARIQGGYVPLTVKRLIEAGQVSVAAAADPKMAVATARAMLYAKALERAGRKCEDILLVFVEQAPGTGLLFLEAQTGPLLGNWRPCVLSTDAVIAAELSLCAGRAVRAGAAAMASLEAFVLDLGRVLDKRSYTTVVPRSQSAVTTEDRLACVDEAEECAIDLPKAQDSADDGQEFSEATLALVCCCERLLATATDFSMARVSTFLAGALWQYGQDVQAILEAPYADGLAIVHRCVRSGSAEVVSALLAWIAFSGARIDLANVGALGLSPLHLAALVPATWPVLAAVPAARKNWRSARSPLDGATPLHLQQMLLAQLPRGALPQDLVDAFAPKPRPVAVPGIAQGSGAITAIENTPSAVPAAGYSGLAAIVSDGNSNGDKTRGDYRRARGAVVLMAIMFVVSVLGAMIPKRLWAPKASVNGEAVPGAASAQRIFAGCCSTMMYVSLLGLAIQFLPLNKAGVLLSLFNPTATCLAP
ncbi:hypothetical protein VOLCADRAFT_107563 [Volvox carteri f. nagariensis]|uniref:SBP-type domain-containing protein n=1 Tax=Volvox carteri f. nagariensis TaxID=3068 RepID=D8UEY5_VOLCA|nr:uncharacterized protein VOLCADRAFT_107563 [Volvox carteri f. nagariensis]EFJ41724.1 hypothetical protein VOLCADRAFT_107563 [Volvox carteri f. nagariensis]|eukprot:XP_002957226.1 hypothetical protein VOLCADRAFT_107563 [Volvox carteri f. nagariensis]